MRLTSSLPSRHNNVAGLVGEQRLAGIKQMGRRFRTTECSPRLNRFFDAYAAR